MSEEGDTPRKSTSPHRRIVKRSHLPMSSAAVTGLVLSFIGCAGIAILALLALTQGVKANMGMPTIAGILTIFAGPILLGLALAGLICGVVALARIARGEVKGRNVAQLAVTMACLSLFAGVVLFAVIVTRLRN